MSDYVYLTGFGSFFPGPPIANDEMEDYLGRIDGRPSRVRHRVLKHNGIQSRHYAIDRQQQSLFRNSEMAANAVNDALASAGVGVEEVDFLAAATTQADLPVPGFASMVHGELAAPPLEVATLHGVCSSGVAALKAAWLQVKGDEKRCAVATASEFPSRLFKASRYEAQGIGGETRLDFDTEFLRWMLSDGAGAAVLQGKPAVGRVSLRVDWIELTSHAGQHPVCMYAGANCDDSGELGRSWLDYESFEAAGSAGALNLKQDVGLLEAIQELSVDAFAAHVAAERVDPNSIDWVLCHYSSEHFLSRVREALSQRDLSIPEDRWFSNLTRRGNVGSASAFVLLEDLMRSGRVSAGQKILLMIPESGRAIVSYAHFTAVEEHCERTEETRPLADRLAEVWEEFEDDLAKVPIVNRMLTGAMTMEDYESLLFHLRQQVIEGSRWIARAASSLDDPLLRSLLLCHAVEEHRDYEMLENDYVALGGCPETIVGGSMNAGSRALSAWMFQQASQPNPLGLLGAMFIIEGLGRNVAGQWASRIQTQLGLDVSRVSFLRYHGENDDDHLEKLQWILESDRITPEIEESIVETARTTARLYTLQLREIDRCS